MGSTLIHLVILVAFALLMAGVVMGKGSPATERTATDVDRLERAAADARSMARIYFGVDPSADSSSEGSISTEISEISSSLALFKGAIQSPDAQRVLAGRTLPDTWVELLQAKSEAEDAQRSLDIVEAALDGVGGDNPDSGSDSDPAIAVTALVDHNRELQIRNLQLIGQLANLERRAGVTGKPPCWVTPDGRAEYTYKITITDMEFVVEPIWRRDRATDVERIGVSASRETVSYDDEGFSRAMYPFLAFGAESDPECRFFVQVVDDTGPLKDAWQERLALVEGYFYKFWLK